MVSLKTYVLFVLLIYICVAIRERLRFYLTFFTEKSFLFFSSTMYQLYTKHRSRLSSKVSLVTRYTRNLIISVRWQLSSGDFPGRRIGKMRSLPPHSLPFHIVAENSVDISPIGSLSPISLSTPPTSSSLFFFIIFQHSRRQMYLCPRARCAFHLSSLQAEHLYTPLGFAPAASFCFPSYPFLRRPLCPFTSRRTRLPHLSSPPRLPVSFPSTIP